MKSVQTPIEVRYQETDQMGVVYHANYLVWFEIGRTKFIEHLGLNYIEMEKNNIVSPVLDAHISYKKPVRYGEKVFVETWLAEYDGIRTVYGYQIIDSQGEVFVTGSTKHVIVIKDNFRPLSLRKAFPTWHELYLKNVEGEK
ncbi:acyl-CoA thioesterase [Ornithinibacillus bavariensis]|uniref:Acyl-CoA thioesterase YneP n=1 Tax=Ornithinibacillus bavariensis TaxID=545502 RepID=A0A919X7G1_9BACI|nr:thioesterase family protein [Ornithinibacillus bavariensis]GIO26258.1 putative acyl-CoA thioesterase YneP [Ornithinibacillus bavariensis]